MWSVQGKPPVPTPHAFLHRDVKCNCKYFEVSPLLGSYTAYDSLAAAQSLCLLLQKADDTVTMQNHFHPPSWLTSTSPNRIYISFKIYLHYHSHLSRLLLSPFHSFSEWRQHGCVFLSKAKRGRRLLLAGWAQFARSLSLTHGVEMSCCKGCIIPLHQMTKPFSYDGRFPLQLRFLLPLLRSVPLICILKSWFICKST